AVSFCRAVNSEGGKVGLEADFAHVEAGLCVACDGEAEDVGHGASGFEDTSAGLRKVHELGKPADDGFFDQLGGLIESGEVGVLGGGEHIGHVREGDSVALDPAEEARLEVAVWIGEDVSEEGFVGGLLSLTGGWNWFV